MFSRKNIITFNKSTLLLLGILVISLFMRIYGINFGLPYIYNLDEPYFVKPAVNMLTGDLNPHAFGHPGSPVMYLLFLVYSVYFLVGWIGGNFPDVRTLINLYENNPEMFHLMGRFLIAVFGIASVFLVYLVGVRTFDKKTGLIAALFMAVSPLHCRYSQIIRTDMIQTFFILVCILFCLFIYQRKETKDYIFAGLFAGLATATKYPGIFVVIPIILAHYFNERDKLYKEGKNLFAKYWLFCGLMLIGGLFVAGGVLVDPSSIRMLVVKHLSLDGVLDRDTLVVLRNLPSMTSKLGFIIMVLAISLKWIKPFGKTISNLLTNRNSLFAIGFILVGFFLGAPYFFIDFPHAITSMLNEFKYTNLGYENPSIIENFLWYISNPLNLGLRGMVLELIALSGIVYAVVKKRKEYLILLSFIIIYFIVVILNRITMDRYVVPLVPFLLIFIAIFLSILIERIKTPLFGKYKSLILLGAVLCFAIPPTFKTLMFNQFILKKETRTVALEWIEENIPIGTKIWMDRYGPQLSEKKYYIEVANIFSVDYPDEIKHYYDLERLIKNNTDYVIISDLIYNRYLARPELYSIPVRFYSALDSNHRLVKVIDPYQLNQPGPIIKIYRLLRQKE